MSDLVRIDVTVSGLDMTTVLSFNEEDGYQVTLADRVAEAIVQRLANDRDNWSSLRERVTAIRDEEIRAHVAPLVADAIMAGVQATNAFGEPSGPPKMLRDLILERAKEQLKAPAGDMYDRRRETWVEKLVREQVEKVLRAELEAAIKDEKEKVVAAVRLQAADLIAQAVAKGVGR